MIITLHYTQEIKQTQEMCQPCICQVKTQKFDSGVLFSELKKCSHASFKCCLKSSSLTLWQAPTQSKTPDLHGASTKSPPSQVTYLFSQVLGPPAAPHPACFM